MKRLILLLSILACVSSYGQDVRGDRIIANKGLFPPVFDTLVAPQREGELHYRVQDAGLYMAISMTATKKWEKMMKAKDSLTILNPTGYVTASILADSAAQLRAALVGGSGWSVEQTQDAIQSMFPLLSYNDGSNSFDLTSQLANRVLAGPVSGGAAAPTYRALVAADIPALTFLGDVTGSQSATVVGKINGVSLAALGTGILKNTTGTGVPSIAIASDFPTLNQNTTGSAASLTTSRNIYGGAFNGTADLTGIIASTYGGTGNGFIKFAGASVSEKTYTLPNASTTILTTNYTGALATGILKNTTTSGALSIAVAADFPTLNQNTTGSAATLTTARDLYGFSFNGSAGTVSGVDIIASGYGGTGNAFTKFAGATTSEKTYTLPDASTTILTKNYTGALATGILKNTTSTGELSIAVAGDFPTLNQNTTGYAAQNWNISGNSITNGVNVLGNTNNADLNFITNNVNTLTLDSIGSRLYLKGGVDPILSIKQSISDKEYQFRIGIGTGIAGGSFNLYDATNSKIRWISSGENVAVGNVTSIPTQSKFYVFGGASGANIDTRADSSIYDETNIETEHSQYDAGTYLGNGVAMQVNGNVGVAGTYSMGYLNRNVGQLRFTNNTNLIRVVNNASLRFGTNNVERMVLDSVGSVGLGVQNVGASAKLDITSTTKGVLLPRMNGTQQAAISSPATGLIIYNTDSTAFCYYNGSVWAKVGGGSGGGGGWGTTGTVATLTGTSTLAMATNTFTFSNGIVAMSNGTSAFSFGSANINVLTDGTTDLGDPDGTSNINIFGSGDGNTIEYISTAHAFTSGTVTITDLAGTGTRIPLISSAGLLSGLANGSNGNVLTLVAGAPVWAAPATSGTVTSVSFTGGLISVATATTTPALTVAGTSGGIPYFSSSSTWASSAALATNAIVIGGGAGAAPSTTTTGTGVLTALGVNVGSAGAFVTFNGALGTPSSGTVTNLTGTASININGTVGATTPAAGTFTTMTGRLVKRTGTTTSSATPTINTDNVEVYTITALSVAITSFTTNLSGTPNLGDQLTIYIKDDGTSRAITWGSSFENGAVPLPTATTISTTLVVSFLRNIDNTKWACMAKSY